MLNFRKAKLFRKPNILNMSIYPIYSTKICQFSFFGHPVWLKQHFIGLVYLFQNKGSQNAQLQKGKTFQETKYFDHVHISHFFHQNMRIFIFWTPCMAKIAFYWLGLSILEKVYQNVQLQKGKTFQEPRYFNHDHIAHFFHQNMWIFIFWTPCITRIAFYWLGLSIFE